VTARKPRKRTPRLPATGVGAASTVAARDALDSLGVVKGAAGIVTTADAAKVADAAVAAAPATQVRRPWRSTVRTVFQLVVGLAPMVPVIVQASGVEQASAGVAGALAISGGITRVMALPQVEAFLQRFVPWLAASPRPAAP